MTTRIIQTEADMNPGNPVPGVSADVAADVPQAQGAPAITKEMADAIASAVTSAVSGIKDSIFAEARRTFTAPKQAKAKDDSAIPPVTAPPDPLKLRALDRALSKTGLASRLSDSQYQRAEKAFAAEDPENADAFVADYFNGFNAGSTTTTTTTPAPQATQAPARAPLNSQPASDRGSPPPSAVPLSEADLRTMSDSDRSHLLKEKGLVWYRNQLAKQLKGSTVLIK